MKTADVTAISAEATDDRLVAAAKSGSPEAFAVLFQRYRPEITRYAGRTLRDDSRAEDVVQDIFISALRGIGSLDRPGGFKPWLYRIAHNACVDHIRRRMKAEEVSFDSDAIHPADEIRLFRQPSSHAALTQKETFSNLRQALGGLPEAQTEILVLRELEGLTYDEIAERMSISRSAVESLLFRARRALRTEFGEIATGERCLRMRAVMAHTVEGVGRRHDRRRLIRHLHGCAGCRRDALMMGLGPLLATEGNKVRNGLARVAALLPLPGFLNRRTVETSRMSSEGGQLTSTSASTAGSSFVSHAQAAITQVTVSAGASVEHAATAIQKAAAVVAAAAVVSGGGYVASEARTEQPTPPPTAAKRVAGAPAPGSIPARPGAVFTQPMPLSLAPLAAGPPVDVLPVPTVISATPAPAETPADAAPEPEPAPAEQPPATDSTTPEEPTFDSSTATSPEPEQVTEVIVEVPATEPPAEPEPPVDTEPPPDPEPEPTPSGDSGGSGDVSGGGGDTGGAISAETTG